MELKEREVLSVAGTAAMFLVGGGILAHGIPAIGHALQAFAAPLGWLGVLLFNLGNAATGLAAGLVVVGAHAAVKRLRSDRATRQP